jgi:hypothetical protein
MKDFSVTSPPAHTAKLEDLHTQILSIYIVPSSMPMLVER